MERNEIKVEIANPAARNWVCSRTALNLKKYKCKSNNYLNNLHLSKLGCHTCKNELS